MQALRAIEESSTWTEMLGIIMPFNNTYNYRKYLSYLDAYDCAKILARLSSLTTRIYGNNNLAAIAGYFELSADRAIVN